MTQPPLPSLGFGLGLRPVHYAHIFEHAPKVDWFEIISENFMDTDGRPKRNLARIREMYPVVMHGVALSIGTVDPLDSEYLHKLKALMDWLKPALVSDHLCWTGLAHRNTHDLLPVPYTEEALKHIVARIRQVQEVLGRPIALENPSTYLEFSHSSMPEAEFIARMAEESGCQLLLDVNNVYVTCYNHRLDPKTYLDTLPLDRVAQIHLSGHSNHGTHIIDTHDHPVIDEVWALYRYVIQQAGRVPSTMVEWDDQIPDFPVLLAELDKARAAAADTSSPLHLPDLARAPAPDHAPALPLQEAQQRLHTAILPGAEDSAPDAWIRPKDDFSPAAQLRVYTNAYRARLHDTSAEDYPALQHWLGDARFTALIADFVRAVPSDHFNIGRYAAKLPAFLATHPLADPFAQELCLLETTVAQLSDPAETTPLRPEDLAGLSPEALMETTLLPRNALQLFAFDHPVNRYYRAVMEETPLPEPAHEASQLAVFRHEDRIWRMELEPAEHHLLTLLFSGLTLGAALEAAQAERPEDTELATAFAPWFARWMRNGLLARPTTESLSAAA